MFISRSCKKSRVTFLADMVLLGARDSSYFSRIVLPSSVHGFLLMVQYGCSNPSHCIPVPARGRSKSKKDAPAPLRALLFICHWPEHRHTALPPGGLGSGVFILGSHTSGLKSEI